MRVAVDKHDTRGFATIVHDQMADDGITDECEPARAGGVGKGHRRAVEVRGSKAASVALLAIMAGGPAIQWNGKIGTAVRCQAPSELLGDDVPGVNLAARKPHGRKELSIRKLWQSLPAAADADVRLDHVVVRLDVAVCDGPVITVAVMGSRLKLKIRIPVTDTAPKQ